MMLRKSCPLCRVLLATTNQSETLKKTPPYGSIVVSEKRKRQNGDQQKEKAYCKV